MNIYWTTLRGVLEGRYNCRPHALAHYRLGHGGANTAATVTPTAPTTEKGRRHERSHEIYIPICMFICRYQAIAIKRPRS